MVPTCCPHVLSSTVVRLSTLLKNVTAVDTDATTISANVALQTAMDEDQYILRLPQPLVERMRFALSSNRRKDAAEDKKVSSFRIDFKDERNATLTVDGEIYPASLVDLPAIVETHKTADKRTFYKSGDVHQMLIVRMPGESAPPSTASSDGLTPAARNAAKRLAEPPRTYPHDMVAAVENRIKYVIDHKVKFRQKKDDPAPRVQEEVVIEEETVSDATKAKSTGDAPENQQTKPAEGGTPLPQTPGPVATPIDAALLAPVAPSPMPEAPTPADMEPSPSPPPLDTPAPGDTPMPDGDEDEREDDEDDDEDDEDLDELEMMAGELMKDEEEEARKRIERSNVDLKISEQKNKIAQLEQQASAAPNVVLKNRILAKMGDLQIELSALEKTRAGLDD